ncbi:alcohol dehydrogenase (plasmid) [Vibrio campbellii]|uniref:zinc-binding dehydrogenase n=1 Tax=Vibrio campbellii TaxID=680 RepID=UPI00026C5169|nr:zinc-binding dehydrogenase [Vibrio campbellii]AXB34688.1 alcohol dehydrogenase [Vibrio campbellii]
MKAIIATQAGSPEVLTIVDTNEPTVKKNEVKIRVKAFGLNKAETYYRAGHFGQLNPELALGIEAAGEVISDASGTYNVGDKVVTAMGGMMFNRHGGYAEIISVNKTNVKKIHSDIDFVTLASLPELYSTAWGALDKTLNIQSGETILVRGATSAVGLAAVTYAKAKGLTVFATTRSKEKAGLLTSMGADNVIIDDGNVGEAVRNLRPEGVDKALEVVGASTVVDTMKAIRPWGEVTVIGLLGGAPVIESFGLMSDLPSSVKLSFFQSGMLGNELPLEASPIDWVAEQITSGKMPSIISNVFEYEDIRKAHSLMDANQANGKLVVKTA